MRTLFLIVLWLPALVVNSQLAYPTGYFRNPLDIPISLSGNFGELRSNHYHMGIDIKTNQRENLSVYAAAEGHVARIKVEPGGFGRALYIDHPNGYTTVYAHLNKFSSKIEAWVKEQQYQQETWQILLAPPAGMFPVKKGELIALSGNTGGSQAPHLHFEIRRTEDDVNLNPLLFGLPVKDNVRPRILRFAVYDRTRSVFEQAPKIAATKSSSPSTYITTPAVVRVSAPLVSFALTAYDTHTGSSNLNGIYAATLRVGGEKEESFLMDRISYNDTRYLNAHIDYRYRSLSRVYLQHLSELPGYINSIYENGNGAGVVDISDGNIHDILIEVRDTDGNISHLKTAVQFDGRAQARPVTPGKMFYPLMLDGEEQENCEFYIGEKCLYDSVHLAYSNRASGNADVVSDIHTIGHSYIPLQDSFLVRIRPDLSFLPEDSARTVMQWFSGNSSRVRKVQWQGEWAAAKFRDFGSFQLVRDSVPPQIVPVGWKDGADFSRASRIVFTVSDNLRQVKNVRAELNGKWLRFTNDKGRNFIYEFDEKCPRGAHLLEIFAEDEAGNRSRAVFNFTR